jgi:hypothetical protein
VWVGHLGSSKNRRDEDRSGGLMSFERGDLLYSKVCNVCAR